MALEATLAQTQAELATERQTTASLTVALNSCTEEKQRLEGEKAALIEVGRHCI